MNLENKILSCIKTSNPKDGDNNVLRNTGIYLILVHVDLNYVCS